MGECYISRKGVSGEEGGVEQLGIYPTGEDGRPAGDVTVLDNVVNLSNWVFQSNNNVTSITFSNGLVAINQNACKSCSSLISVNLPNSLTKIGNASFMNCNNLKNVIVSADASYTFSGNTFRDCTFLTSESFNNIMKHCTEVGSYEFAQCNKGLIDIETPIFGNYMFQFCYALKKVVGGGITTADCTFYRCTALEEVYLIDGLTTIGAYVFFDCTALKTVYLPSSIITAKYDSLTTATASNYVFTGCTALEDVRLGKDWNMSLRLDVSDNITHDSMIAMFNNLKDLTGETAKILTLGSANLAKVTDEEKAIAINKNWVLN